MTPAGAFDGVDFAQAFSGAQWCDIVQRRDVCPQLPPHVLLHAGPPFRHAPPAPVVNAAAQALVFDGLAADAAGARRLIASGAVVLEPAQDYGIVTPLAQVVSSSMLLGAVKHHAQIAYGALLEGGAPALRFGSPASECRERLAVLNCRLIRSVAAHVRRAPVGLDDVVRRAVAARDDCHARTATANAALVSLIDGLDANVATLLNAVPAFVLPILMAGAAAALRHHRSTVEAMGGNGVDFGIRWRGESGWRQVPAQAPGGQSLDAPSPDAPEMGHPVPALPAIGDSVVVDYCGLGGQVDAPMLRRALLDASSGIIDAARIAAGGLSPMFNLGVLDAAGDLGLIGRGTYRPPTALFAWTAMPAAASAGDAETL